MFRSYSESIRRTGGKQKSSPTLQLFSCDLCDQHNWMSETDVELHRKEIHFEVICKQMENHKERFCTICMKLQDNHSTLITHVKTRHLLSSPNARRIEREIFICNDCDHIFFNKDMLCAHILYCHMWSTKVRNTKSFTCPKCKKTCPMKSIWFHLQLHEIPSISACDICLAYFPSLSELEKHLKIHPMHYKCEICNYHTSKDVHFEAHMDYHHKSPFKQRTQIGKMAKEAFRRQAIGSTRLRYNIHHALRGLDLPRFLQICTLCREICTDKIEVRNHILRDHMRVEETKKPARCLCGAEFFNRVLMKHHIFKEKGEHREIIGNETPSLLPNAPPQAAADIEIEEASSPEQYIVLEEYQEEPEASVNTEDQQTAAGNLRKDQKTPKKQLTYMYTQIDENKSARTLRQKSTQNTEDMAIEEAASPEQYIILEDHLETPEETAAEDLKAEHLHAEDQEETVDQLTYVYAEVDEEHLVTIDSVTNEEVIGF